MKGNDEMYFVEHLFYKQYLLNIVGQILMTRFLENIVEIDAFLSKLLKIISFAHARWNCLTKLIS